MSEWVSENEQDEVVNEEVRAPACLIWQRVLKAKEASKKPNLATRHTSKEVHHAAVRRQGNTASDCLPLRNQSLTMHSPPADHVLT